MRVVIVGYGVQGRKRRAVAGDEVVAVIDPVAPEATAKRLQDLAFHDFDVAVVCTPDEPKPALLKALLGAGKHVLVEKPLVAEDDAVLEELAEIAASTGAVCVTAYNHRFEPHYVRMRDLIRSGALGRIYSVRMFYGNGTARLVRESDWRDQGAGVLPDLGSHLLDTLRTWFPGGDGVPGADAWDYGVRTARRHENRSFDQVVVAADPADGPTVQLEMTMLSWRNHFTCDVFAEHGSAHIESLCKWGPSTFTRRTRVLPSGRPPEEAVTLVQADPTWEAEYAHFKQLCAAGRGTGIANDIWLNRTLRSLAREAFDRFGETA
ncbi:MAG: Gfo/Idh/MocA family oxidoreductase [Thalassobaculum sp.]|uniref:Gfo/Idh/MocA family protein n=1 Tax=Thalassobaculum sp. TaxID=2022740 RepID=UPI0032F00B74